VEPEPLASIGGNAAVIGIGIASAMFLCGLLICVVRGIGGAVSKPTKV